MNASIRSFLNIGLLFTLAAQLSCEPVDRDRSGGAPERPNIILIVADDLGYGDLGSYGQAKVRTSVLDQLAAEGIRFTDFCAGSTVCAPSRASLLTGLHTGHSPVCENPRWTRSGHPVDFVSEDHLFSEVLQGAGYKTAIIGKWGMAEDTMIEGLAANPAMPLQQGFDYFLGYRHHGDAHHYCGCVTITYNAPLKKYLMCVTDGWPTNAKMSSYILESDNLTGPWKLVTYMKEFGEQGYFLNFPSKFISEDGKTAWLCYSGNFWDEANGVSIGVNPPGSHYGMVLQEVELKS